MKRCVHFENGALLPTGRLRRGFTLLEICIVLLIIAVLFGVMMPSIQTAFVESTVRADARQIQLMVKSALVQSSDERRVYVIDLTASGLNLHPAEAAGDEDKSTADDAHVSYTLNPTDQLQVADPEREHSWIKMPDTSWIFRPGELCPATPVRLVHGRASIEMTFNALTGNMEDEASYFP